MITPPAEDDATEHSPDPAGDRIRIEHPDADAADRNRRYFGATALQRFAAARVLVVGAGAVGNEVCKHLGMIGVGEIVLVDPDVVTDSNLNRCVLFRPGQGAARMPKVQAVAAAFVEHGWNTRIDARAIGIEDVPPEVWLDADLVVCGVDDDHARYWLNRQLLTHALTDGRSRFVIEGAMGSDFTQCRTLELPRTACLCCNWTTDLLDAVLQRRKLRTCMEFFVESARIFPAISTQTSLVSAQMATDAIRILAHQADYRATGEWPAERDGRMVPMVGKLVRYETPTARCQVASIMRNPKCIEPFCREGGGAR
ncbi:MAG: ThiF family adenylyltransferase [Planctomycetota bacterium]